MTTIDAKTLALKKWDKRNHTFLSKMIDREMSFHDRYRRKKPDATVKHPWDPPTERHHRSSTKKTSRKEVCMPHLDSARTTYYDKPHGKRVVGKNNCETKKWRPNGCDAWFANIGTPAPSVYSARSRSSSRPEASARSTASHRSTGSQRRSARSAHSARSGRDSAASSVAGASVSKPAWSQSAAELWDKKIQLERQLEAIREEQDALMCRQIAEMSHVCFDRRAE